MPVPPLLTYSNVSYGIGEFSVRVQWQTLSDDHGAVDNYALILYRDEIVIEMSQMTSSTEKRVLFLLSIPLRFMRITVLELETQVHLK